MTAARLSTLSGRQQKLTVLDADHLGRMTLGDCSLEQEVLEIFARQTALTLARINGAEPAHAAAAAHTLKGSARGVGAWRVERAAERLEEAVADGDEEAIKTAIAELEAAGLEVRTAISTRLGHRSPASRSATRGHQPRDC
jgi:HPt (histidine-containing phosphotransfer) domain-containing protein